MKHLIVDGYNVVRQTPPYRHLAEMDALEAARTALVSDVAAYAQGDWDATIVFDAYSNPHSQGLPHEVAGVTVIFSPFGVDADSVIERLARIYREQGEHVEVVTSDAQTQWAVMGQMVARRSAGEFAEELHSEVAAWKEHAPSGPRASRIEDRIPNHIREQLSRWATGEPPSSGS